MKHLGLVSLFLLASTATPVAAQSAFSNFSGEWAGSGWLTAEPGAPMERGRCKANAERDGDGQTFTIRGRCAVAAGSGAMILRFVDDGNGRVRAGFTSPAIEGVTQMVGTPVEGTIRLTTRTPYSINGELYDVRSTITFQNDNLFSVRDWNAPAGTDQWQLVTDLNFTRQEGSE